MVFLCVLTRYVASSYKDIEVYMMHVYTLQFVIHIHTHILCTALD